VIEVEQADRVDPPAPLAERDVPVGHVGQSLPGEAEGRHAIPAHPVEREEAPQVQ
jgi:hypothetical protein